MNKIIVSGRLTKDALVQANSNGTTITYICVAVERGYSATRQAQHQSVDYITCIYVRNGHMKLAKYLTKGTAVTVEGELHIDIKGSTGKVDFYHPFVNIFVDKIEFQKTNPSPTSSTRSTSVPTTVIESTTNPNLLENLPGNYNSDIPF